MDQTDGKPRRRKGDGSQLPDGRWRVRLRQPDGSYKDFYGTTLREAQKKRNAARKRLDDGLPLLDERITVAQFLDQWLEQVCRTNLRPNVFIRYETNCRVHIKPAIGQIRLARLQPQNVQSLYAAKLASGLAPRTVKQIHAVLHNALDVALRWDMVARNVADAVTPPKVPKGERTPLNAEQSIALLDTVQGGPIECIVTLALTTGLREGELLGLHWPDVHTDTSDPYIEVKSQVQRVPHQGWNEWAPKSDMGRRRILLTGIGVEALRRQRVRVAQMRLAAERWTDTDLVHPNQVGKPIERGNLARRYFKPALKRAGLPAIHFHDLRHSTATLLRALRVDLKLIQEILGHASLSITSDIYTHQVPELQADAMRRLNALLSR